MAKGPSNREERPEDDAYYETRVDLFSQGDIFRDVPLAYPSPASEIIEALEPDGGSRRFLSGPFQTGLAMLTTPSCSMGPQGNADGYSHPVRTLVPVLPLTGEMEEVLGGGGSMGLLRKYDELINYMYVPPNLALGFPESVAPLYMPVTIHHRIIEDQRMTQLTLEGARQLQRKLTWFFTGILQVRAGFTPPID